MSDNNKKTIVVIEDEAVLQKMLNVELLRNDYNVLSAMDGKSGLNIIQTENPDLILLDIYLPGMNGDEVLVKLKGDPKTKSIPVLILSNNDENEMRSKCMELGADGYYIKVDTKLEDFAKKIKEILI